LSANIGPTLANNIGGTTQHVMDIISWKTSVKHANRYRAATHRVRHHQLSPL